MHRMTNANAETHDHHSDRTCGIFAEFESDHSPDTVNPGQPVPFAPEKDRRRVPTLPPFGKSRQLSIFPVFQKGGRVKSPQEERNAQDCRIRLWPRELRHLCGSACAWPASLATRSCPEQLTALRKVRVVMLIPIRGITPPNSENSRAPASLELAAGDCLVSLSCDQIPPLA